jgi:hypothetical protein
MKLHAATSIVLALALATGCGSSGHATDGAGGSGGDASALACGSDTCTANQLCAIPSCGGAPPPCMALPDGGQCPSGWTTVANCPLSGGPGCQPPPCTPPAPHCVDIAAACNGAPACTCLPANVCQGGGSCSFIGDGKVFCASA